MSGRTQVHNIGRRRAWVIWGVGMAVYVLAIFYRTSLGVAGILAAERFQINASQLATFTVLQLSVYPRCRSRSGSGSTATAPSGCSRWAPF